MESVLPRARRAAVVRALIDAHPYEEPAFDLIELADPGTSTTGTGRIGTVPEMPLRELRRPGGRGPARHGARGAGRR